MRALGTMRREVGFAAALLRGAARPVALPWKLTVCLTFRCNHRCGICSIWSRDKGEELDARAWDAVFASVPSLRWLDVTGGEIVLRRDLDAILDAVHRRLPKLAMLHFPTNGLLPDAVERAARRAVRPGGPRVLVSVSFDGPPALHDRLRGHDGAFDAAIETLARLERIPGLTVHPGMTLQAGNLHAVDDTIAALAAAHPSFRARDLHVNFEHRSPHYFGTEGRRGVEADALAAVLARLRRPVDGPVAAVERAYLRHSQRHLRTGRSPVPCASGEVSAYVAPDGQVFACTIDPRPIGRLADHAFDLAALWRGDARRALRADIAADRCVGCWTPCEANPSLLRRPLAVLTA